MRRSRRRGRRRSSAPFTIIALVGIFLLMIGSVVAALELGGGDDVADVDDPAVQVTPGAEVSRLETAVAQNPDDVETMGILAEVLANSGRIPESAPWFERAVTAQPNDADLRVAFGRALLRLGSTFDAEVHLRKAVELDPSSASAAYYLASTYAAMGESRRADAVTWYERAIELDPESYLAADARRQLDELGVASPAAGP